MPWPVSRFPSVSYLSVRSVPQLLAEAFRKAGIAMPRLGVRSYSVHQRMMLLATGRFLSAEVGSVLRVNAERFALEVLPVNLAIDPWPVWIVTLKNRTLSPAVQSFLDCTHEIAKLMARRDELNSRRQGRRS